MNNTFCSNCHRIPSQCCCSPVKELTDEEIKQIYKETHFSETIGDCDYMEFARAILRKAQEK